MLIREEQASSRGEFGARGDGNGDDCVLRVLLMKVSGDGHVSNVVSVGELFLVVELTMQGAARCRILKSESKRYWKTELAVG